MEEMIKEELAEDEKCFIDSCKRVISSDEGKEALKQLALHHENPEFDYKNAKEIK